MEVKLVVCWLDSKPLQNAPRMIYPLLLLFRWIVLTKKLRECNLYKSNFLIEDNQRNNSIFFSKHKNITSLYMHEKTLFFFEKQKATWNKTFKEDIFVFFFNKANRTNITKKQSLTTIKIYENELISKLKINLF